MHGESEGCQTGYQNTTQETGIDTDSGPATANRPKTGNRPDRRRFAFRTRSEVLRCSNCFSATLICCFSATLICSFSATLICCFSARLFVAFPQRCTRRRRHVLAKERQSHWRQRKENEQGPGPIGKRGRGHRLRACLLAGVALGRELVEVARFTVRLVLVVPKFCLA